LDITKLNNEVDKIQNEELHTFIIDILSKIPENSWKMATSRDYHAIDERGAWGNLIHTLRVCAICDRVADALSLPQIHTDILRSSAILHDSCKHGLNAELVYITHDHPDIARKMIMNNAIDNKYKEAVATIVSKHTGRWDKLKPTEWQIGDKIDLSFILHMADCIEARIAEITNDCLK
jgi:HD-GYP domain-containing protein (c-di-GMP phosphodiesterase class II)